jgi:hypothetical protein
MLIYDETEELERYILQESKISMVYIFLVRKFIGEYRPCASYGTC